MQSENLTDIFFPKEKKIHHCLWILCEYISIEYSALYIQQKEKKKVKKKRIIFSYFLQYCFEVTLNI